MTHYKLDKHIGLCSEVSFKPYTLFNSIKMINCPECKLIYNYFKDDIKARYRYTRRDLITMGVLKA